MHVNLSSWSFSAGGRHVDDRGNNFGEEPCHVIHSLRYMGHGIRMKDFDFKSTEHSRLKAAPIFITLSYLGG